VLFKTATESDWWFRAYREGRHDLFFEAHCQDCPAFPVGAKDLLTRVFSVDPAARPTAVEMLQHPWLLAGGAGGGEDGVSASGGAAAEEEATCIEAAVDKMAAAAVLATRLAVAAKAKAEAFCPGGRGGGGGQ